MVREQILAVQRMQDYIDQHLCQNITLADLSTASLFSPWHSHRMFKEYTNLTPGCPVFLYPSHDTIKVDKTKGAIDMQTCCMNDGKDLCLTVYNDTLSRLLTQYI
jgi:AraC-like DNA-binding protein